MQGNGFRDQQADFDSNNVQILGISFDSAEDNKAFADKFSYGFPLLCDVDRKVGMAYGACDSADAGYAKRVTYVIDEAGQITHALPEVDPTTHTADILALVGG